MRRAGGGLIPKIPVTIAYKSKRFPVPALVDTGADVTFIPEDVADVLGIKYHRGREVSITGIDKELRCTEHRVSITFFDGSDTVVVENVPVHVPKLSQKKIGVLLGRRGLLDQFELLINEKKDVISLEHLK